MNNDRLTQEINSTIKSIQDLKYRQFIGGDSWVVYRTEINFTSILGHVYKVDFYPDTSGRYVAKAYLTVPERDIAGSDQAMHPDPNVDGRWWMAQNHVGDATIFVYSTKKGILNLTDVSTTVSA
jgi:hypothetical protein